MTFTECMGSTNFERMIELAEEVFSAKNDSMQLDVDEEVIEKLKNIHPSAVIELDEGDGPLVWILLLPTLSILMEEFITGRITEKELFDLTLPDTVYETIYLCSAMVLKEHRRKGYVKRLTKHAILEIKKDHPIKSLFVWPFTSEGELAAEAIATSCELPLFKRTS